jgi:phage baseplate assembly protein W
MSAEREALQKRLLGWSAACDLIQPGADIGRDLRLEAGPNGLDLARIDGVANLDQSLSIALTTLLGSDIFNTQFGFDGLNALVEETNPVMVRERVRISVIQTLRRDARIRRIIDVKLEDGRLERPDTRELDVRVAFEVQTGDQLNVAVGNFIRV